METFREWVLGHVAHLLLSALVIGGPLIYHFGQYANRIDDHMKLAQHTGQRKENAATTKAINEVDTKVEVLKETVDATNKKLDQQEVAADKFRGEQRTVNESITRALGRIEGKLGP